MTASARRVPDCSYPAAAPERNRSVGSQAGRLLIAGDGQPPLGQRWLTMVTPPSVGVLDLIPQPTWPALADRVGTPGAVILGERP